MKNKAKWKNKNRRNWKNKFKLVIKMFSPQKGTYSMVGQADQNTFWIKSNKKGMEPPCWQRENKYTPLFLFSHRPKNTGKNGRNGKNMQKKGTWGVRVLREYIPENDEPEVTDNDAEEIGYY